MLPNGINSDETQDAEFDRAFELLSELVDLREANEQFVVRENAVYQTCVVLWMLVYQRMKPDASLEAAVKHLIETKPDYLPDNKRVREGNLSTSSAASWITLPRCAMKAARLSPGTNAIEKKC